MARKIKGVAPNGTVSWEGEVSPSGIPRDLYGVVLPTVDEIFRFGMQPGTRCRIQEPTQVLVYELSGGFAWNLVVASALPSELDWVGMLTVSDLPANASVQPCRFLYVTNSIATDTLITTAPPGVELTIGAIGFSGDFNHDTGAQVAGPPHQSRLRLSGGANFNTGTHGTLTVVYGGDLYWYEIGRRG